MAKEINAITLAAFLHDIGKIYQRCGDEKLTEYNTTYCPEHKGHLSHLHAGFTAQFFDKEIGNIFKVYDFSDESDKKIANIASNHHKPSSFYDWIIAAADRLSSGFERDKFSEYENLTAEEEKQQYNYKTSRLISIFSKIKLNPKLTIKEKFYNLEKLCPEIFPTKLTDISKEEAEQEYQILKNNFEEDFTKLDTYKNFNNFYNALLTLFEKYFWCVPSSSYNTLADVSLFDHLKTTASVATALYKFHIELNKTDIIDIENYSTNQTKFVLIQGDFSGIQDFIFSRFGESNKYAAKILRAKSFYVSIFTEIAAYLLINEFETNSSSIILNAGGKFTLLLPKLSNYKDKIKKVKKRINDYLIKISFGQTIFNLAWVELSGFDFTGSRFGEKMKELSHNLNIDKLKPAIENPIFEHYLKEVSEAGRVCSIDGYLPKEKGKDFSFLSDQFIKIGTKLPKSNFINIYFSNKGKFQLLDVEITFNLSEKPEEQADLIFKINPDENYTGYADKMLAYYIPTFKENERNSEKYKDINEDEDESEIKTFEHIAADAKIKEINKNGEEKFKGKSFLSILKADIDNLGQIFSKGFGSNVTISKYASLSRMFDYFFTAWLPKKIKEKYSSVYTVFAGGDDLFLIGAYNQIIDLSKEIAEHLKKYSAGNLDIHISAGIVLKKPQVPVYQMAETSENALQISKQNIGKNSITIFDITVRWDEYFQLLDLIEDIDDFFNRDVKTGYIYNMLKYIDMSEQLKKGRLTFANRKNALWIAYLNYSTVRNYKDEELKEELLTFFYNKIKYYGKKLIIPISLSLYKRRN